MKQRRCHGFTLLEVLVALVLLALFASTSYRALDSVLDTERYVSAEMARWRQLALGFNRIKGDFANVVAGIESRPGQRRGLYAGQEEDGTPYIELDRLLPEDQTGGVQRIGYRYRDGTLWRQIWHDAAPASEPPTEVAALAGLNGLDLRCMDRLGNWHAGWSPDAGFGVLPGAVEIQFRFVDGPPLRRVFLLQ